MRTPLHDGWSVRAVAGEVPAAVAGVRVAATVPGCVHTDLLAAGLIADPYLDDNERRQAWIGSADWEYTATFEWLDDGAERADLVFDGLDTVARIELDGHELARTRNMHRGYRLPVRELLVPGPHQLTVTFASAVRYADAASLQLGARPHVNPHPFNAIRKMACNFGWDWGPDLVTAGIWRPVHLHGWSTARLATVRPLATVDGSRGTVAVHLEVERAGDRSGSSAPLPVRVTVGGARVEGQVAAGESAAVVEVVLEEVRRWWPRSHGDQPLYDVEVVLGDPAGGALDRWAGRVGFRTVRLDTAPDRHGTPFTLVVNDRPVFVKGANWIPDDAFPHRVDRGRYAARIAQAEDAGINLLRVWGGGIFESDDFYRICDERGVMTWQDFLFACAAYAEEEPLRSEVEAEARENVVRLLPHPSLVLWNGCNENVWGHADWGWQPQLDGRSWGLGYYTELLPRVVAELDPHRPYSPASPWSPGGPGYGEPGAAHPNDPAHGTMHVWDVWNQRDHGAYRDHVPRFAAEFGWQGPPTWATLRRSVSDDPLTPESPGMLVHQKAEQGHHKLTAGLVPHFRVPDDMADWHWAMSLNQARAIRLAVEHFRSWSPRCAGSVVWQLNDCWPVTSWAAVDGDGRAKPLLHALRHAHADRLLTLQPRAGGLALVLVNDTDDAWRGAVEVTRRGFDGAVLEKAALAAAVDARGTVELPLPAGVAAPGDAAAELLVAELDGVRGLWFFAEDRDSHLVAPRLGVRADRTPSGYRVEVRAESLVRDLALLPDRVAPDAAVDDMLLTLLPGERAVLHVTTAADVGPARWSDREVLRSANQLVTG